MKREVTVEKRKGKGLVYTNVCPVRKEDHLEIRVGSAKCKACPHFVKALGSGWIHCNAIAEGE